MHDQLTHVADLAQRPYVCVQVVPTAVCATAGLAQYSGSLPPHGGSLPTG
jgi:hypothetical protein